MLNYLGVYVHVLIFTKRLTILTSIIIIYLFSILLSRNNNYDLLVWLFDIIIDHAGSSNSSIGKMRYKIKLKYSLS